MVLYSDISLTKVLYALVYVCKLFVVKKDDALTTEMVIEHCRVHLTGYKIPKHVVFKDDLPKTNVGKILRRELRD